MANALFENSKHFENRGNIYTIYAEKECAVKFVQDKISKSYQGVIRGFHADEKIWKLVTCLHGRVKFVTYDLEQDYKQEYILQGDSPSSVSVLIPPNTLNAHQCLSDNCIFHYKWSDYYTGPKDQRSVFFNDPDINPEWDTSFGFIVADRDQKAPLLQDLKLWLM